MNALVFRQAGDIRLERRPIPQIGAGEILVKVKAAGVCGTDIRIFRGTKRIEGPRIIGHEFAGEVAETGAGSPFAVNDRVTVYPSIPCGSCHACLAGRGNICVRRTTLGYELDGGFAEYVKIPAIAVERGNVSLLPPEIDFEEGAVSEPLAAAYNGIKRAGIQSGDTVLIIGAGPIGQLHSQLARLEGAARVIVAEPQAKKRDLAMQLGADFVFDPSEEDASDVVAKLTQGQGVDAAIVDVGIPAVIESSVSLVKKGGSYVIFAGCPEHSRITIDPNLIHYRELVVTGASASTPEHQRLMLNQVVAGKIRLRAIISAVLPVEYWLDAFVMKENYRGLKTVLKF